jgi:hypothetical protein
MSSRLSSVCNHQTLALFWNGRHRSQLSLHGPVGSSSLGSLRRLLQPPVSAKHQEPYFCCLALFFLRQNLHIHTHTNTKSSKYGRRSASIASSGGANPRNSATRQITDIEVLQQAEQSLQKASGGFSFFGGRQDKCTAR